MKVTDAPCRIVGLMLGEITIRLLKGSTAGQAGVTTKFLLLDEQAGSSGSLEIGGASFSPKAQAAIAKFIEDMEEEAMTHVFKVTEEPVKQSDSPEQKAEPNQF